MADLDMIYDSGRAVPASPYLSYLVSADPYASGQVMPVQDGHLTFPITSRLAPGLLERERQAFDAAWLAQPMFLAGADPRSLRWLTFNRFRLMRIGAWGLVPQARSANDFKAIESIAPELPFAPAGDWLEGHLLAQGVTVYPLLIDTDGVARQSLADDRYGPSYVSFAAPVAPVPPQEVLP